MKNRFLVILVLAVVLGISVFCLVKALNAPRIGVVDNATIITNFSEAIAAKKKFDEQKAVWDGNLKSLGDSIKAAVNLMAGEYDNASQKRKLELQKNLQKWNEQYANYSNSVGNLVKKREMEMLQPVIDKINSFVKSWGAQHGYDIIYGTASGGVILTVSEKLNITDRILADLNELYGSKSVQQADTTGNKKDTISGTDTVSSHKN
ncbi:MAG TPA: OmpH family outer membrane protein [Chitinispirillaceae bacterium]|nr:OmpH family outer membrane protein [Chitinispirillaceae bacterium]